jgi:hypothetical protein
MPRIQPKCQLVDKPLRIDLPMEIDLGNNPGDLLADESSG